MDFSGKAAVINGADTQLGRAIALAFSKSTASVGITGSDSKKLAETLSLLQPFAGTARAYSGNFAEATESEKCVASLSRELGGRIDILINVHAPAEAESKGTKASRTQTVRYMSIAAAQFLASPGGSVINVTSSVGLQGTGGNVEEAIVAGGLIALSRSSAKELAPKQITVNCICIGPLRQEEAENVPMKRPSTAEDVIPAILFLASDRARYVTGLVLSVDGGHARLP